MTLGRRIDDRRLAIGISQAELARRVGMRQSTINSLINGDSRSSRKIVQIARELQTTPAYLIGEIDDPEEGAPPPEPEPQVLHVMLPVALPARSALTRMFLGHLRSLGTWRDLPEDDLAHELATLLPTGLGTLRGPLRFEPSGDDDDDDEHAEEPAIADRALRRATRT